MRSRRVMVGAALVLILPFVHASDPPSADKARIAKLITQLGSDSYLEREQARKELHTIGQPALAALRRAAHTGNLETSRRASQLIRAIEEQALTAALLTPKRVRQRVLRR